MIARTTRALVAAGLGLALVSACSSTPPEQGLVTRSGSGLVVDGAPFRFVGVNLYDAAATSRYSCNPATRMSDAQLSKAFRFLRQEAGATVVRFWAYQTYTDGGRDFRGVDRVIRAARENGLRVIPVLEDGPGDCSTGERGVAKDELPGDDYYTEGYRIPYGSARLSLRDYAALMVKHYRDEPTILAWMMMNEAETRTRSADGTSSLVAFAQDMGTVMRAQRPTQLITLGTQANGAPGTSGRDFSDIYRLDVLDLAEVHDWGFYGSDTEALPGSQDGALPDPEGSCANQDAKIACSFARAVDLGKPIIVGEAGITAQDAPARDRRAELLRAKVDADFAVGADGYLVWHLSTAPTDGYDLIAAQDDPTFPMLKQVAQGLRPPTS